MDCPHQPLGGHPFPFLPPPPLIWHQGYPQPGQTPFLHNQRLHIHDLSNLEDCSRLVQQLREVSAHQHVHQCPPMHGASHGQPPTAFSPVRHNDQFQFKQEVHQGIPPAPVGRCFQPVLATGIPARHAIHHHYRPAQPPPPPPRVMRPMYQANNKRQPGRLVASRKPEGQLVVATKRSDPAAVRHGAYPRPYAWIKYGLPTNQEFQKAYCALSLVASTRQS